MRLTMSIGADVPRSVVLDGRHLRQVLLNLLGNAIKFTAAGEVRLLHRSRGTTAAWPSRSATPAPASKPEALTEIFAAFAQTKAGAAAGGTGLGLTICESPDHEDGRRAEGGERSRRGKPVLFHAAAASR